MKHPTQLSERQKATLSFVPMLLFLILYPLQGHGDELKLIASPKEVARIAGVKQKHAVKLPKVVPHFKVKKQLRFTLTAYSSTKDQCDADPFTTASGSKVGEGLIANNGLPFGTRIRIPEYFGDRVFIVQDRMNARHGSHVADIWMTSRNQAKQWGVKYGAKVEVLERVLES